MTLLRRLTGWVGRAGGRATIAPPGGTAARRVSPGGPPRREPEPDGPRPGPRL